jgi:hypothetical protein
MALPTTVAPAKAAVHRLVSRGLLLALVIALLVAAGYNLGYRINLQTKSIPVPTAQTTPDEVVLAYTAAYNHRDFDTMKTIYPSSQDAFSRFRAMGTMKDVRITQSRPATDSDLSGTFPEPGHSYYRVEVSLDYTGLTGSDLAYDSGPNGWTYWLERPDATSPWTIADQGNG